LHNCLAHSTCTQIKRSATTAERVFQDTTSQNLICRHFLQNLRWL